MEAIISGIQQMGIGVSNVEKAFQWYKEYFGTDVVIFDEKAAAEYMLPYTGGTPKNRHAILAINLQGGGGFEIWQHKDFEPRAAEFDLRPGDYGIYACKIKCKDIVALYAIYKQKGANVSNIYTDSLHRSYFYIRDPFQNLFQIVEAKGKEHWFTEDNKLTGGVYGGIVGCSNIEESKKFYAQMLGYDKVLYESEDIFPDLEYLGSPDTRFKRAVLTHSQERVGAFSQLLGSSEIELIQAIDRETPCRKIFENRMWGELGFIQICYDIRYMDSMREKAESLQHGFTVDSSRQNPKFGMGDAAGNFSYNEDPDGTLIEYVETWKIPILKKFGIFLNLRKFKADKALPKWMLKCLKFMKK